MNYKIGDVVQLKSGGPKMTVQRIIGDDSATAAHKIQDSALKQAGYRDGDLLCQWFNNDKLESGIFNPAMLD